MPQECRKIFSNHIIFLEGRKAIHQFSLDQFSALWPTDCGSYSLKCADRGLKIGPFSGFQGILTPAPPNVHTVFALKSKFNLFISEGVSNGRK